VEIDARAGGRWYFRVAVLGCACWWVGMCVVRDRMRISRSEGRVDRCGRGEEVPSASGSRGARARRGPDGVSEGLGSVGSQVGK
jgi:hypothetical protein